MDFGHFRETYFSTILEAFSAGRTLFFYVWQKQPVGSFSVWPFLHIYKKMLFLDVDRWMRVKKLVWLVWISLRVDGTKALSWKVLGQNLVWQLFCRGDILEPCSSWEDVISFFFSREKTIFWENMNPPKDVIFSSCLIIFVQVSQCQSFCPSIPPFFHTPLFSELDTGWLSVGHW